MSGGRVTVRQRTLDLLASLARAGGTTPSNNEIRRVCGFASDAAVGVLLAQLASSGHIRREGDKKHRRFWVAEVEAWTGWATIDGQPMCEQDSGGVVSDLSRPQADAVARAVADSPGGASVGGVRSANTAGDVYPAGASAVPVPAATPATAPLDLARRQADAVPVAGEPSDEGYHSGARGRRRREWMADQVLAMLERAAADALPCPKNAALCAAFGGSTSEVPAVLARLVEAGAIRVERAGKRRRVLIVDVGMWTDWSRGDERGLEEMPDHLISAKRAEEAEIAARRVATERAHDERRDRALAAEAAGRVPAGTAMQAMMLADRVASVGRALQDGWPDTHRLLVRLSVAQSVRPLVLIDRLIRDEAAREGVKTPPVRQAPGEDEDDVAVMDAADDAAPRDVLDEGSWQ